MGVSHSKRKKDKKWKKYPDIDSGVASCSDLDTFQLLSRKRQLHQSMDLSDRSSFHGSSSIYYSRDSLSTESKQTTLSMQSARSLWSTSLSSVQSHQLEKINLDNHPDLTKLQNEQNARRENMEQRIVKIRTSAIQAAERRKFAEMFKAGPREQDPRTVSLLREASEALATAADREHTPESYEDCDDDVADDDKGEIIPVKIMPESRQQAGSQENQSLSFGSLNFNDPVMFLLLPVLLPMFIIVCIIRGLCQPSALNNGNSRQKKQN